MRTSILVAIAFSAAATLPVLAQTSPGAAGSSGASGQQQGGGAQSGGQSLLVPRGEIRSQLQTAGFKNVQILDAAYLVQAETPTGEAVLMVVNPSGAMRNVLSGGAAGAQGSGGGSGGQSSGGSGGQPGSKPQ